HAIWSVPRLHECSRRMARYANDRIRLAERPGNTATHPVAVVDMHVDEGLGPCEGRKDHACKRVARSVSGMQDLNPEAPDIRGEPQQARCRRQGIGNAGNKLLKLGLSPQRWPEVRRTQRNARNGAQLIERWCS